MVANRSVPVDTVLPHIAYLDVSVAAAWLGRVFGFVEHYRYGEGAGRGVQMQLAKGCIMLTQAGREQTPAQLGCGTQYLTVFVEDVDAHYARSKAEGARIWEELHETIYGERQYGAEDPDGHRWLFSQHARDVEPAEWGARVAGQPE
jgi:uncharacterized glyoxalase superfamily protein PhnB